jgi:hypothetical protein
MYFLEAGTGNRARTVLQDVTSKREEAVPKGNCELRTR